MCNNAKIPYVSYSVCVNFIKGLFAYDERAFVAILSLQSHNHKCFLQPLMQSANVRPLICKDSLIQQFQSPKSQTNELSKSFIVAISCFD
jgi:hypothetical protein